LVTRVIAIDLKKSSWGELFASFKELRKERYDVVFDLQGNTKTALVTLWARAKDKVGFGFKTAPERINIIATTHQYNPPKGQNIRDDYLFLATSYYKDTAPLSEAVNFPLSQAEKVIFDEMMSKVHRPLWLICPHTAWPNKQLSQVTLHGFLEKITARYHPTFMFLSGNDTEKTISESLVSQFHSAHLLHKPSFSLLQQIMRQAQLVISMDSFPLHLAATTNTPTYSIFGPSSSRKYAPQGSDHRAFQGSCPYGVKDFEKRCPKLRTCPTGACMKELSADDIFNHFAAATIASTI
ncbi:MAG TPA: glycosyltransferase family 9 protein, partial [Chlamydiales bacterium]|nr:glycosyltransferase family 9 protein [Chlamydiales bacterium]